MRKKQPLCQEECWLVVESSQSQCNPEKHQKTRFRGSPTLAGSLSLFLSLCRERGAPPAALHSLPLPCLPIFATPARRDLLERTCGQMDRHESRTEHSRNNTFSPLRSPYLDADAFEISALPLLGESPPPSAVDREGLLDGAGGSPVIPHVLCRALRTLCEGTFLSRPAAMDSAVERATDERQDASRG